MADPGSTWSRSAADAAGRPARRARRARVAASALVVAGALGYLFYGTVSEGAEYYKHVDEVEAAPGRWQGKRLQLHGFVAPGSLLRKKGTMQFRFDVERNGRRIPAVYQGIVPDTFKEGAEVVVKGRLGPDGTLQGTEIMAKCPSKYEAGRADGKLPPDAVPAATGATGAPGAPAPGTSY